MYFIYEGGREIERIKNVDFEMCVWFFNYKTKVFKCEIVDILEYIYVKAS